MTTEALIFGDRLGTRIVIVFPEATIALIASPNWREVDYGPQITLHSVAMKRQACQSWQRLFGLINIVTYSHSH